MSTSETVRSRALTPGKLAFVGHYGSTLLGQGFTLGLGILTGILAARMLGPVGRRGVRCHHHMANRGRWPAFPWD